jgi:hypothetical protein
MDFLGRNNGEGVCEVVDDGIFEDAALPGGTTQVQTNLIAGHTECPGDKWASGIVAVGGFKQGDRGFLEDVIAISKITYQRPNECGNHRLSQGPVSHHNPGVFVQIQVSRERGIP